MACLIAVVMVSGIAAWWTIPVHRLPSAELPRLVVRGAWPGVSPEAVEAFLTSPLESAIQELPGVESVHSESLEGSALIDIFFPAKTEMQVARLTVSERIASSRSDLPASVGQILVEPWRPPELPSDEPMLIWAFTGPFELGDLQRFLDDHVVDVLSRIDGVAAVQTVGGWDPGLVVRTDRMLLGAYGIRQHDVMHGLGQLGRSHEVGRVSSHGRSSGVSVVMPLHTAHDLDAVVVGEVQQTPVRLGDVARLSEGSGPVTHVERINGNPSVRLLVHREPSANVVRVARAVRAGIAELRQDLPEGARFIPERDEGAEIQAELRDLGIRAVVSLSMIALVVGTLLRSPGPVVCVLVAVIVSGLLALIVLKLAGLSLNLLTLAGLALGFGMMVDNAVVVLDATLRRLGRGDDPETAAATGAREVMPAVAGATVTTLGALAPFGYLQDELRVFYLPLAIVVGLALASSFVVAFAAVPVIAAHLPHAGVGVRTGGWGVRGLVRILTVTFRHPWAASLLVAGLLGGSWLMFDRSVSRGLLWSGSQASESMVLVDVRLPDGSSLEQADALVAMVEARILGSHRIERVVSSIGAGRGITAISFPDSLADSSDPVVLRDRLTAWSAGVGGADIRVFGAGPAFQGVSPPAPTYALQILGYDYRRLEAIAVDVGARLGRLARVREVDTDADRLRGSQSMEYVVRADRNRLASVGMTPRDLVEQVRLAAEPTARRLSVRMGDGTRTVYTGAGHGDDLEVTSIARFPVQAGNGDFVALGRVASIVPQSVPPAIRRENQQYQRVVTWEFRGDARLGDAVRDGVIESTELPPGYAIRALGGLRWSADDHRQLVVVLVLSLIFVYGVTATLLESLRQPWVILLSVPPALIGVFLVFWFTGATFTREAWIGLVLTGGIAVNNSILLVVQANRLRTTDGLGLRKATIRATVERVVPILTTTATTVFGVLPMVLLDTHIDDGIWNAIGLTLAGGLAASAAFTLTVTPALYHLFETRSESATFGG